MSNGDYKECPELGIYHLVNQDTGETVPLPCNRYCCKYCGPRKAYKLQKHLQNQFECYQYVRLFTFTFRTSIFFNQYHCHKRSTEIWRRFINNIRRDKSLAEKLQNFQYVKVKEFTKRGYVHFHVLSTEYMPWRVLQNHWLNAINVVMNINGKNGHVNAKGIFNAKKGAKYVAKYVIKSAEEFENRLAKYYDHNRKKFKLYTKSGKLKLFYPRSPIHKWIFEIIYDSSVEDHLTCNIYSQLPEKLALFYSNLPPPQEENKFGRFQLPEWEELIPDPIELERFFINSLN